MLELEMRTLAPGRQSIDAALDLAACRLRRWLHERVAAAVGWPQRRRSPVARLLTLDNQLLADSGLRRSELWAAAHGLLDLETGTSGPV